MNLPPLCDGTEKHSHSKIGINPFTVDQIVWHTHEHTALDKEFNRIHHHAPIEHEGLTLDQLQNEIEYLDVPF
jgi:hypothetical protein